MNHSHFLPANPQPAVVACARALLPLALRQHCAVRRVEIDDGDLQRLIGLRDQRLVLACNHPTNADPALMFELSKRSGIDFNYLCCREAFDGWRGRWGTLIQNLGAYSVVRGTVDRESFRYTRQLLAQRAAKLVIFPEGEVYSQNDSLLPFQVGAVQLALWGREEARKHEPQAEVLLLPCAVRYRFAGDVRQALEAKLAALEHDLHLDRGPADLYGRMRRLAVTVLEGVERQYNLKAPEGKAGELTPRFEAAKEAALTRAAQLLGVELPKGTLPERMRALLHTAEQELHDKEQAGALPASLENHRAHRVRLAWLDLQRLANWIAVYDGYVRQEPDQEHIAEVVQRLEQDIRGHSSPAGLRVGQVRVGEPITLPATVGKRDLPALTLRLEKAVGKLLREPKRQI